MAVTIDQMSGMPQMRSAFKGWTKRINLVRITQQVVRGQVTDQEENFYFDGTIQPLDPEQIALKEEGQRSFEWLQIHITNGGQQLETNDRIIYNGDPYKVMAVKDYQLNNYREYHLIKDYE